MDPKSNRGAKVRRFYGGCATKTCRRERATAFILSKTSLIFHLQKHYGHLIERDEIVNEVWLAELDAGARKGENLVSYVCNAVQRQARNGQALLNYTTDHARNNDGEQIN